MTSSASDYQPHYDPLKMLASPEEIINLLFVFLQHPHDFENNTSHLKMFNKY